MISEKKIFKFQIIKSNLKSILAFILITYIIFLKLINI